ncbi:putative leader peptide [Nonomuraea sp. NPDC049309]
MTRTVLFARLHVDLCRVAAGLCRRSLTSP